MTDDAASPAPQKRGAVIVVSARSATEFKDPGKVSKRVMGIVNFGIPQGLALGLAEQAGISTFVESGTFKGETARWAARHFASVHTIENAEVLFQRAVKTLHDQPRVQCHLGDSRIVLPTILGDIGAKPVLAWLDAHWCTGESAGMGDECPLLEELSAFAQRPADVLLIDDARFFLCAPNHPHDAKQWPTIAQVVHALESGDNRRYVQIIDDVIIAVPDEPRLVSWLRNHAQQRATAHWEQHQRAVPRKQDKRLARSIIHRLRRIKALAKPRPQAAELPPTQPANSLQLPWRWDQQPYNRVALLTTLASHLAATDYLEIGCADDSVFKALPVDHKLGVDPARGGNRRMSSDEFFRINELAFDLVFIDGLHHYEQVRRDLSNALKCLRPGGMIALHDMLPCNELEQAVPQRSAVWTGDVWRVAFDVLECTAIDFCVVEIDHGIGVLRIKDRQAAPLELPRAKIDASFEFFVAKHAQLPLHSWQQFKAWLGPASRSQDTGRDS